MYFIIVCKSVYSKHSTFIVFLSFQKKAEWSSIGRYHQEITSLKNLFLSKQWAWNSISPHGKASSWQQWAVHKPSVMARLPRPAQKKAWLQLSTNHQRHRQSGSTSPVRWARCCVSWCLPHHLSSQGEAWDSQTSWQTARDSREGQDHRSRLPLQIHLQTNYIFCHRKFKLIWKLF